MSRPSYILILYTTIYRTGGQKFARAAATLAEEKRQEFTNDEIVSKAVESKKEFVAAIEAIERGGGEIRELHFIGHSGLYGIMFGTTKWPEQFSPFEWRNLRIPFAAGAHAYFHACRTGRWFAPFFARTFNVAASGYFWYTTVSTQKKKFGWEGFGDTSSTAQKPVFIISVPGKKSHGVLGSLKKYVTRPETYPMLQFAANNEKVDTTYDSVASLYDETFEDISVRNDELKWLRRQLKDLKPQKILDIGCGTGSFLRGVEDLVGSADGVDLSKQMILHAQKRADQSGSKKLNFTSIDGPQLPFADNTFDVVTSVLSFRYLDWDPVIAEILRVLKPGGHLLVIDMVAAPVQLKHWPRFFIDKVRQQVSLMAHPRYRQALRKMVTSQGWKQMLAYNPMRAEHEMKWYLQSRFPNGDMGVINYAWNSRILAFRSPPVHQKAAAPMSFP